MTRPATPRNESEHRRLFWGRPARMLRELVSLLLLASALAGCVVIPQPHESVELSRVEGVLFSDGVPLANAILTMNALSNYEPCENPIAKAKTDASGHFIFPEVKTRKLWRMVTLAPSSPTHSMTVCLHNQGEVSAIFDRRIWAALPTRLLLECELADASGGDRVCRVADWSGYNYLQGDEHYSECRPESPTDRRVLDGGERISCESN